MKLIADTNRIVAALIKDSANRKVLLSDKCQEPPVNRPVAYCSSTNGTVVLEHAQNSTASIIHRMVEF